MSLQLGSTQSYTPVQTNPSVMPVIPVTPESRLRSNTNSTLTPEQKNTIQHSVDDKISEQVENVKNNYQTAKDIDLMQSYFQQQQKLFDIYTQSTQSNSQNATQSTTKSNNDSFENNSAVSALTKTYAELYQLHQNIKEGNSQLPSIDIDDIESGQGDSELMPAGAPSMNSGNPVIDASTNIQVNNMQASNMNNALSSKQLESYNSLMMPSTSTYIHVSA